MQYRYSKPVLAQMTLKSE